MSVPTGMSRPQLQQQFSASHLYNDDEPLPPPPLNYRPPTVGVGSQSNFSQSLLNTATNSSTPSEIDLPNAIAGVQLGHQQVVCMNLIENTWNFSKLITVWAEQPAKLLLPLTSQFCILTTKKTSYLPLHRLWIRLQPHKATMQQQVDYSFWLQLQSKLFISFKVFTFCFLAPTNLCHQLRLPTTLNSRPSTLL